MLMANCRHILQNPGKHLAGMGKIPWLISSACYSFRLEIQSPTGLVLGPVLFTATQKRQSRHNSGLSVAYFLSEGAKEGHGQPHSHVCGVSALRQPGSQRVGRVEQKTFCCSLTARMCRFFPFFKRTERNLKRKREK